MRDLVRSEVEAALTRVDRLKTPNLYRFDVEPLIAAARAWLAEGDATPEAGSLSTDSAKSVWIVGKFGEPWELMGAFDSQKEALDAARDGEFVGRVPMGRAPDETVDFIDVRVVQK